MNRVGVRSIIQQGFVVITTKGLLKTVIMLVKLKMDMGDIIPINKNILRHINMIMEFIIKKMLVRLKIVIV